MPASTLSSWARLIWEELNARQLDANDLFRQVGLNPAQLSSGTARFPVDKMGQLWRLALEITGDPCLGVETGLRWHATTFHALGFAWLASTSLGEALHRLTRYGRFVSDALRYQLVTGELDYYFRMEINPELNGSQYEQNTSPATDASIVALLKMLRLLLGDSYHPKQITCSHSPNSASLMLERIASCPVHYGGEFVELVFDHHDVENPLTSGNDELSMAHDQIILKHLADLDEDNLVDQVQIRIFEKLPSGEVKDEDIARDLNMSTRTMQRRLNETGTSFTVLLQEARQKLAQQYIHDNKLAVSEIAYLLGFSDQSNFTRAFKRWYGVSPSQYRLQQPLEKPEFIPALPQ